MRMKTTMINRKRAKRKLAVIKHLLDQFINYVIEFYNFKGAGNGNNDEYFEKFQQLQKKREKLETKAKISHRVYCPYFHELKLI